MKVVFRNPSKELITQLEKKEGVVLDFPDLAEREDELIINDVIEIGDLSRLERSADFALYKRDRILFVDNADFSSMEVQL